MAEAWIGGNPAALDAAVARAAKLLEESRFPLVAGLGTDIAGARAAIALARRLGGAIDHMHSAALLRDLDVMREGGMMMTTPNEARLRADLLLLVGPGLIEAWPELPDRLLRHMSGRRIVWLCPGGDSVDAKFQTEIVGDDTADLPILLASLRARCAARPVRATTIPAEKLDALAAELGKARFGVAVWSAASLDPLSIEMLCGLVKDLNVNTRFSGLPLAPPDNAAGVQQASGWLTGFPLRTGFGRSYPEHDPWRFDAERLVESGEADCAIWISAYRATSPRWKRDIPLIALTQSAAGFARAPHVAIAVGRPGGDHDSVEYLAATGTLATIRSSTQSISVSHALRLIAEALPPERPC